MMLLKKHRALIYFTLPLVLLLLALIPNQSKAQYGLVDTPNDTLSRSVLIHPVIKGEMVSSEHEYKPNLGLGDQLARDFTIGKITEQGIVRRFKSDGLKNEDWYSWRKDVMAPFDGTIKKINHPASSNKPGVMDREAPTGFILFQHANGTTIVYAHVREIKVKKGQRVKAGDVVAKVGNNATSRTPHIHVGAWKDKTPLQIQVDLYANQRNKEKSKSDSK